MTPGRIVNLSRMAEKDSRSGTPKPSMAGEDYVQSTRIDRLLEEIVAEVDELVRTKEGREFEGLLRRQLERVVLSVKTVQQAAGQVPMEPRDEPYFTAEWQQFERAWERETRAALPVASASSLEVLLKEREQLERDIKDLYQRDPYYRSSA